jgi:hypothetical protein
MCDASSSSHFGVSNLTTSLFHITTPPLARYNKHEKSCLSPHRRLSVSVPYRTSMISCEFKTFMFDPALLPLSRMTFFGEKAICLVWNSWLLSGTRLFHKQPNNRITKVESMGVGSARVRTCYSVGNEDFWGSGMNYGSGLQNWASIEAEWTQN